MKQKFKSNVHYPSLLVLFIVAVSFAFTSCKRNPPGNQKDVNRLYVSNADVDPAIANLDIYEDPDKNPFLVVEANTGAKDGNGVVVDQKNDILFQASRQNKSISVFMNASMISANPPPLTTFTDATLSSAREIAYDNSSYTLFVANNADSSIRVYKNAISLSGNVIGKTIKLSAEPWGIHYDAAANRLLVLIDKNGRRVEVYNNPSSLEGAVTPNATLNVADRPNGDFTRLHGLTYSSKLDILLITEIGEAAAPAMATPGKPAFNADGGIYVFENANSKLTGGGTFNATRIIYGPDTQLGNPVDVAIDDTDQKLIYVAEKANKKILVFTLTDNDNKSPKTIISTVKLPEDLFIDVRKKSNHSDK